MKSAYQKEAQVTDDVFKPFGHDPKNVPLVEDINHHELAQPSHTWSYHNEHGKVVGLICRFDVESEDGTKRKEIRPYSHLSKNGSNPRWRWKGLSEPRPLYNLHRISAEHAKPILICEGEKAADAGAELFPEHIATTPQFGAKSPHKTDWSIVSGRNIIIAADVDEAGKEFADQVGQLARKNQAASVKLLSLEMIGKSIPKPDGNIEVDAKGVCPAKYDLADALVGGWTADHVSKLLNKHKGTFLKYQIDPAWPYFIGREKVFHVSEDQKGQQVLQPVFTKMRVLGLARDKNSEDWATVAEITDGNGYKHIDLIRASEINGPRINDVKERLTAKGLVFENRARSTDELWRFVSHAKVDKDLTLISQCGWQNEELYATPSWFKSKDPNSEVFFDCKAEDESTFSSRGTLDDWKRHIAIYGGDNSLIAFSISAALAGSLLGPLSKDGFGVHIFGTSSTGKTTLLRLASSVWGNPSSNIKNWNMTMTALEGTAVIHNDALLCLDEISQAEPQNVYAAGYELANGQGRGRGTVQGLARERHTWRLLTLSNGEIPFEQLALSKSNGKAMAGQKARMVSIPADAGNKLGIFNHVPEHIGGAAEFAQMLNQNAKEYFGTAAPAFVELFIQHQQEATSFLEQTSSQFVAQACSDGFDGQVRRVADHFGIIAAAGEYAIEKGVVPWEKHHAFQSAMDAFKSWLNHRGGTVSDELIQGVRTVRQFFQQHGESKFTYMFKSGGRWEADCQPQEDALRSTQNRMGYRYKDAMGQWKYFVFPDAFNTEICKGLDAPMIAKELARLNHIEKDSAGKHTVSKTVPGHGKMRVYVVKSSVIDAEV
ncbi:MAG: DUF927 domain-containing protein [Lentilitoribacter sp.]